MCICATLDTYLSKRESWSTQKSQILISFNQVLPKLSSFYSFPAEKRLCVFATLDTYLSKRKSWGTQETQVLVRFVKPHRALTSSTVSRCLKDGFPKTGIDTTMFKGHSTCAASITKAEVPRASVCDMMKQVSLQFKIFT